MTKPFNLKPSGTDAFGDPDVPSQIRKAVGAGPTEQVRVHTPQFKRTDGNKVVFIPRTKEELDHLKKLSHEDLKALGVGVWSKEDNHTHYLFPHEWYDHIPEGYPIVGISGREEKFKRGETDNDKRFGMLAYGFKVKR